MLNGVACILGVFLAACSISSLAADDCKGEACADIDFAFENGCYVTRNLGSRKVKVTRGPYSFELSPGKSHTLRIGASCPQGWVGGEDRADYIGPSKTTSTEPKPPTTTPQSNPVASTNSVPPPLKGGPCELGDPNYWDFSKCPQNNCNGRDCIRGTRGVPRQ